mmetsp:Transcript_41450/g.29875  ORF Transcript_41450/g.29875 Transcript_41450/m.29875 type:complete len:98 (+) Transcript_41450:1245-1538(+)
MADMDQPEEQEQGLSENDKSFSPEQIKAFKELAANPEVYQMLVDSLAPSIWESQDVKKGILCQLFGGLAKEFSQSGKGRFRSEINVLLCGDPSTAKS